MRGRVMGFSVRCCAASLDHTSLPLSMPHRFLDIFWEHIALKQAREVRYRGCLECTQGGDEAHLGQRRPSTCISRAQRCVVVVSSTVLIASGGRIVNQGSPVCLSVDTGRLIVETTTGDLEPTPLRHSVEK